VDNEKTLLVDATKINNIIINSDDERREDAIKLLFYRYSIFIDNIKEGEDNNIEEALLNAIHKDSLAKALEYGMSLGAEELGTFDAKKRVNKYCKKLEITL
jgi:hypothetical protein